MKPPMPCLRAKYEISERNDGYPSSDPDGRPNQRAPRLSFQTSLLYSAKPSIFSVGALGHASKLPSTTMREGRLPERPAVTCAPLTSIPMSKEESISFTLRKTLSGQTSAPRRKWTSSMRLDLPAPLRDWRWLGAFALVGEHDIKARPKVRALKEARSLPNQADHGADLRTRFRGHNRPRQSNKEVERENKPLVVERSVGSIQEFGGRVSFQSATSSSAAQRAEDLGPDADQGALRTDMFGGQDHVAASVSPGLRRCRTHRKNR